LQVAKKDALQDIRKAWLRLPSIFEAIEAAFRRHDIKQEVATFLNRFLVSQRAGLEVIFSRFVSNGFSLLAGSVIQSYYVIQLAVSKLPFIGDIYVFDEGRSSSFNMRIQTAIELTRSKLDSEGLLEPTRLITIRQVVFFFISPSREAKSFTKRKDTTKNQSISAEIATIRTLIEETPFQGSGVVDLLSGASRSVTRVLPLVDASPDVADEFYNLVELLNSRLAALIDHACIPVVQATPWAALQSAIALISPALRHLAKLQESPVRADSQDAKARCKSCEEMLLRYVEATQNFRR
jgi:hypothetical protein